MMRSFASLLLLANIVNAYLPIVPFNRWHCIDFVKNIDKTKPHSYNIGELPLVTWFDNDNKPHSTINICEHMGSKLDEGKIHNGCLKCPYHGLSYDETKTFGDTIVFQDKLWWSYEPIKEHPPSIPFYNNKNFETSFIKVDVDASVKDCILNTMDINHPEFIHNNIFGFGSNFPPTNIKTIYYPDKDMKIGLSFNYKSTSKLAKLKKELHQSANFHIYDFPYTSWSRVSLPTKEHLYVNVNMLPLTKNKTRWLVTLKHNYWKTNVEKHFMKFAANCILYQDQQQMNRQANESILKNLIINKTELNNEDHIAPINKMLDNYRYPSNEMVIMLYNYHLTKK